MALLDARVDGRPLRLPEGPPYSCEALQDLSGAAFWMPPGDPRLAAIHQGGASDTPPMDNLQGLVRAWQEHPEWLDFLDPSAPNHADKLRERALYLRLWERWVPQAGRVLDLGGGCGRFSTWLLERGLSVDVVDPDLRSLWRALQHAVGLPGRIDLHWTTGEALPELPPLDLAVAAEVLCYVEDPKAIEAALWERLKPGGVLLFSVEARRGWASAMDVHAGTLDALLGDGVVHVPGDVWVRTYEEEEIRDLLADWEILLLQPTHYASSGPFEAAAAPESLEDLVAWEDRLRQNAWTRPWNRAWTGVARKPSTGSQVGP